MLFLLSIALQAYALAPLAGTIIKTEAKAAFQYVSGVTGDSVSKPVQITILPLEHAMFDAAKSVQALPGQRVVILMQLRNLGNVMSHYQFSLNSAGAFQIADPKLYLDVRQNGAFDPDSPLIAALSANADPSHAGTPLALAAGQHATLLLVGRMPADASGRITLELNTVTQLQAVRASAQLTLNITDGALVTVQQQVSSLWPEPGATVDFSVIARNHGDREAAGTNEVNAEKIHIDGQLKTVFLLRHMVPTGAFYVPGTLRHNAAKGLSLYRLASDPSGHYRQLSTTPPKADDAASAIELAVALDQLAMDATLQANFSMRLATDAEAIIDAVVEAYFNQGSVRSNQISLQPGAAKTPDVVPLAKVVDIAVGEIATYSFSARNIGGKATDPAQVMVIRPTLPVGLSIVNATAGAAWECDVSSTPLQCSTNQILESGNASTALTLTVRAEQNALPEGALETILEGTVTVEGGGEPIQNTGNNRLTYVSHVGVGATLSGRVWRDTAQNGRYDAGDQLLSGWKVELRAANLAGEPGTVIKTVNTDAQGAYQLTAIPPGGPYRLRFLSPQGILTGTPMDGEDGQPQAQAQRDFNSGEMEYMHITAGRTYTGQSLAVSPSGRVYDATTRMPVDKATVRMSTDQTAFDPAKHLIGIDHTGETMTDEDGFFYFALTPRAPGGEYRFAVSAAGYSEGFSKQLPPQEAPIQLRATSAAVPGVFKASPGFNLPAVGEVVRYYSAMQRDVGAPRLVNNLLAIDLIPDATSGLMLRKSADRPEVELIDFVNYKLELTYKGARSLDGFEILDNLPVGFAYVDGSARMRLSGSGQTSIQPEVHQGRLRFTSPQTQWTADTAIEISYRARVGAGASEGMLAVSRAKASSTNLVSNEAMVSLRVVGGVFTSDAYILGQVVLACNDSNAKKEPQGVPNVRLYLEDGSFVDTDEDGKYSFYGVKPLTHVIKLDPTTLPPGSAPILLVNRQAGNAGSQFVDLRNGELGRADFSLTCNAAIEADVQMRREQAQQRVPEIQTALQRQFDVRGVETNVVDVKGRTASGLLNAVATNTVNATNTVQPKQLAQSAVIAVVADIAVVETSAEAAQATLAAADFDQLLQSADPALDFIDLQEGQQQPRRQVNVRVKGPIGSDLRLDVNGLLINMDRIGTRSEVVSRQIAAVEYVGVALQAGLNTLTIRAGAQTKTITVIAPGDLAHVVITAAEQAIADGKTPIGVKVTTTDSAGLPITAPHLVTLTTTAGRWDVLDSTPDQAGVQVVIEGGSAVFQLLPPSVPGDAIVQVVSGPVSARHTVRLSAEMRPMIAAGIVEGVISLRNGQIETAGSHDGFERELSRMGRDWDGGKTQAGARAAFFLKGKVKGEYLLTTAYDSEKEVKDRLFRDIQPDRYYPVYGDSGQRGFDAQSTSRLYLRVDKENSYLVYGDFLTQDVNSVRQLTRYQRGVTGLKHHYQSADGTINANVFASRDSLVQQVKEIAADGTRGPFAMFGADFVENSERIEIITYDRNQPGIVLTTRMQARLADYDIEPLSGTLLMKVLVPSLDSNGNRNYIRVTYESNGNGAKFWLYGGDVEVKVANGVTVGAIAVEDRNPAQVRTLRGATLQTEIAPGTTLAAELAQTETANVHGQGARIELQHQSADVKARLQAVHTDAGFDNLNAAVPAGKTDIRAQVDYRLTERDTLKAELVKSRTSAGQNTSLGSGIGASSGISSSIGSSSSLGSGISNSVSTELKGLLVSAEHVFEGGVRAEIGSRIVRGQATSAAVANDLNLNTMRGKLTTPVPGFASASVYTEYERDLRHADQRMLAFGGNYQYNASTRFYARHEAVSSLGNLYELGDQKQGSQYRSFAGVETEYMKDASFFSEYRLGSAMDGRDAQAAIGLRNGWSLAEGLRLNTSYERTRGLSNNGTSASSNADATAVTGQIDYLASPRWKGSAGMEVRQSERERGTLNTLGIAFKLDHDWTFLGKNTLYQTTGRDATTGDGMRMRQRVGFAYRQTDHNAINALGYYEHRLESGSLTLLPDARRQVHLLSTHASVKPSRPLTLSGRYAYKHVSEGGVIDSQLQGHLFSGRVSHDLTQKWDTSLAASLFADNAGQRRYALGGEVGYQMRNDLWISGGYNFFGFTDRDFRDIAQTTQGVYLRLRYKFDENSF
ncbi:SdrD B-like domain-containing protein [Glaciimonas sp. GG7]